MNLLFIGLIVAAGMGLSFEAGLLGLWESKLVIFGRL